MRISVKGKNAKVSDELQLHVERKVSKLDRYLDNIMEAKVELANESTRSAADQHRVQLTITRNGVLLRAEERGEDFYTALDAVLEKMHKQIRRFKDKRHDKHKEGPSVAAGATAPVLEEQEPLALEEEETPETLSEVVRVKRFAMKPMFEDEAIEQMELLGHDFFVFYNAALEKINVVYRRSDGNYGLIDPELT